MTHDYVTSFLVWEREQRASRITLNDPHLCCIQKQRLQTANPKLKLACLRKDSSTQGIPTCIGCYVDKRALTGMTGSLTIQMEIKSRLPKLGAASFLNGGLGQLHSPPFSQGSLLLI